MEETDHILDAPPAEAGRLEYAGFWIRTAAYIIDGIILYAASFIVGVILSGVVEGILGSIISIVIGVTYFSLMESSSYQATVGKMAVGVKVGDINGGQISAVNAIGRYFAKWISAILLCIGFMMVGWDEKKQGIHDKLANTYVFFK